jgi:hypothetical protein
MGARSRTAHFDRPPGFHDIFEAPESGATHDETDWYASGGGADPTEFARVKFDIAVAQCLVEYQGAIPVADRQAVRLGVFVEIIGQN